LLFGVCPWFSSKRQTLLIPKSENVFTVALRVSEEDRIHANRHRGAILRFTGLSGAGKSILAIELEVKSGEKPVEACLADLLAFVERRLAL